MKVWFAIGAMGVAGAFLGCAGKNDSTYTDVGNPTGGSGGAFNGFGGSGTSGGSGGNGGAPLATGLSPVVTITSPVGLSNPNEPGVVVQNDLTVTCVADRSPLDGARPVDGSKVKIEVIDRDGKSLGKKSGTPTPSGYTADFVLTDVPNGRISISCVAPDTASPANVTTTVIHNYVDHGPTITVISPVADSAHTLASALPVRFKVDPAPLDEGDIGAEVGAVALKIAAMDVEIPPGANDSGTYELDVALTGPPFTTQLSGETSVLITAANTRSPEAATRQANYTFSIDGEGPVIKVDSPKDNAVVGGVVPLVFSVEDKGAGVDEDTVVVEINDQSYPFDVTQNWERSGDDFTFRFDWSNAGTSRVQVTVNIRASDGVGNPAIGASMLLYLDNVAPTVDLDPANVRERNALENECSASFDPVGHWSINDLDGSYGTPVDGSFKHFPIASAARFRAFVFEDSNRAVGFNTVHYAGTDATKTRLYIQPNPATAQTPLLVDTSGDGVCDEIGDDTNAIKSSIMDKVTPAGAVFYDQDPAIAPLPAGCTLRATNSPNTLCSQTSDMWRVLRHQKATNSETTIYAVGVMASGILCTGSDWEFGSYTSQDGWVCFAVKAVDNVGNVGVSRPVRVCMDDPDRPGEPACKTSSTIPPTCTDGCTPPPRANLGIIDY